MQIIEITNTMDIFEYSDYKKYVVDSLKSHPKQGRGQYSLIAKHLNIHTSFVSHIFNGDKHLSFEQSCDLAQFMGLPQLQEDYFIQLVLRARAGTERARKKCDQHLQALKQKSQNIKERVSNDVVLSESQTSIFLSHWHYSAVKLMISLKSFKTIDEMRLKLQISQKRMTEVLEFLANSGLLKFENGLYTQGPARLHFGSDSPFVSRHHTNWRIKAMEKLNDIDETSLHFTMPANLSKKDVLDIRKKIVALIESTTQTVDNSQPEVMYCLNIDWMKVID